MHWPTVDLVLHKRRSRSLEGLFGRYCLALLLVVCWTTLTEVLAQVPDASQAEIREGLSLLRSGQASQAKLKFDAAVKIAPRSPDALTWRGICENQMGEYSEAATDFRAALRGDRSLLPAHYNLGLSLIRLNETGPAIEQFEIVIATDPKALQALYNLAILLESKKSYEEAAERLTVAHELDPEDRGVTVHLLKDRLKGPKSVDVSMLVHDLMSDSTPVEAQRLAGAELLQANRFADAAALLEEAHSRAPQAEGLDLLLARAEIGQGRDTDAIPLLQNTTSTNSDERSYLLGVAYLGTGEIQKATENFESAVKLDPKDARSLYQLGLLAAQEPQSEQDAVKLLQGAVSLDSGNSLYMLGLARVLLATDQAETARALLQKIPTHDEDTSDRHTLTGIAMAATHSIREAIPELSMALEEDPNQALASNVLGFCLFQQNQYAPAAEAYGRASELEPKRPLYARDAALAYARADQNGLALKFAERASAATTASAADHALLGKLYAAAKRDQDAVRELRRAVELDPDLDSPPYLLARTYLRMGDRQQAEEWSARLTALKQKHEAAFNLEKKSEATPVRSSTLLRGGLIHGDEAGAP